MIRKLREGTRREKGQTLVLVAVMMFALLGLMALAIDLSYVFVQRRNMQNAADAGALAGARLVAHFSANPTLNTRYRDVYLAAAGAATANGGTNVRAWLIHCGDRGRYTELKATNYSTLGRCPCACGVIVETGGSFQTFFSRLFGVTAMSAEAEAWAEFGLPKYLTGGIAPIALRNTVFEAGTYGKVGSSYTIWDDHKQAGGGNRGWLGLDCSYPEKSSACSPDANSLKQWMDPPYYTGPVSVGDILGGDPGTKASVLDHANVGEILIIPVFDYVYHYTNSKYCNPKDPKYNQSKCRAGEAFEYTIPVYTEDNGYNGKYYYHIIGFAAFEVQSVQKGGSAKAIVGKLTHLAAQNGDWQCPEHVEWANGNHRSFGVTVIKLTK